MAGDEPPHTYAKGGQVHTVVSQPDVCGIHLPLTTRHWTRSKSDIDAFVTHEINFAKRPIQCAIGIFSRRIYDNQIIYFHDILLLEICASGLANGLHYWRRFAPRAFAGGLLSAVNDDCVADESSRPVHAVLEGV